MSTQILTHINKFDLARKYSKHFVKYGVTSALELAHFFAQASHESGLKAKIESFNYRADKLIGIFGSHRINLAECNLYGRKETKTGVIIQKANQEMLANIVYGRNWGQKNLGNIVHGDGWKYRGRGWFQITGKWNYTKLSRDTGIDFINNPDLLLEEEYSVIAALWYWTTNNIGQHARLDNLDAVSDKINIGSLTKTYGDSINFKDRQLKLKQFKLIFQVA